METDPECLSSVTLIVLGRDLNPDTVSHELSLTPSKSWSKGEQKQIERSDGSQRVFDSRYEWGGWKLFMDSKLNNDLLEAQLQFWIDLLQDKTEAITRLKSHGLQCLLDVFITTDATASVVLPEELQKSLAALGLEIELSIMMGEGWERKANNSMEGICR